MTKNILIIFIIVFVALGAYLLGTKKSGQVNYNGSISTPTPGVEATSFEECVAAGNPVMESYPRQCRHGDKHFIEEIGNVNEKADLIVVDSPRPNETVNSSFTVTGKARGNWFFEASFPAYLYDESGNELASAIVQAEGEWMTTEFVPFAFTLEYDKPLTEKGELVLKKDNPSGLPENDDELRIPLKLQ